jgi:hypothetical protein
VIPLAAIYHGREVERGCTMGARGSHELHYVREWPLERDRENKHNV